MWSRRREILLCFRERRCVFYTSYLDLMGIQVNPCDIHRGEYFHVFFLFVEWSSRDIFVHWNWKYWETKLNVLLLSCKWKPFAKVLQGGRKIPKHILGPHGTAQDSTITKCQMHHGEGVNTREMLILNKVFTLTGGFTHDLWFMFQVWLKIKTIPYGPKTILNSTFSFKLG